MKADVIVLERQRESEEWERRVSNRGDDNSTSEAFSRWVAKVNGPRFLVLDYLDNPKDENSITTESEESLCEVLAFKIEAAMARGRPLHICMAVSPTVRAAVAELCGKAREGFSGPTH